MIKLLVIALALTTVAQAQTPPPLNDALKAYFPGTVYADAVWPSAGTSSSWNICEVSFNTNAQTVTLEWSFKASGAGVRDKIDVQTVGYQPTAVCRKAAIGSTLFVAGYSARSGKVIVEQWDFTNIVLGTTTGGPSGSTTSSLSYTVNKAIIFNDTTVLPLTDIAHNLYASELWLFEFGGTHTIWSLDPSTSQISWVTDSTVVADLAQKRTIRMMKIKPAAAEPGFILLFEEASCWTKATNPGYADNFLIMRDEDLDGSFLGASDEIAVIDYDDFTARGYDTHMDGYYQ